MEGFTPSFFLQVVIAICSGAGAFYAMKADMKNMFRRLETEERLREKHAEDDNANFKEVHAKVDGVTDRLSMLEGKVLR